MIDAFRRSSASRITAVIPYYGYARQDRKDKPRVPISAKLMANLITAAGANRVLTMDLHKAQIQGFFDIPVDHLFAAPVIIEHLKMLNTPNLTIVSPDAGGAERARAYAKRIDAELAIIDKRRSDEGTAEVMNVIGDVAGRTCIMQDDIIDTAGTIVKAAIALKANGAARIFACAVHGVLSGPAIERIEKAPIDQLIVTNTIPLNGERAKYCKKIGRSRWPNCWARRFGVFTKRRRFLRCLCRVPAVRLPVSSRLSGNRKPEAGEAESGKRETGTSETDMEAHTARREDERPAARTRPAACACAGRFPPSSTAPRRTRRPRSPSIRRCCSASCAPTRASTR